MLLQNRKDMLKKVELFVARARPEIVSMDNERLFLFVAGFVDDGDTALLADQGGMERVRISFKNFIKRESLLTQ